MKAIDLKTEYLVNPLGIDIPEPCLFWKCEGGITQSAYQIKATVDGKPYNTGKIASSAMTLVPFKAKLVSRSCVTWQVRLWDEQDKPGEWSEEAHFEMGLLDQDDWRASWISRALKAKKNEILPVDCFRKTFTCTNIVKARLYVTACGVYDLRLNGKPLSDAVLTPGSTDFRKRAQYQVYDVASLLFEGENVLTAELSAGWLYSQKQPTEIDYTFGNEPALLVQLELEDEQGDALIVCSDASWEWSNDGPMCFADNKGGEVVDARKQPSFAAHAREATKTIELCASNSLAIKEHEHFAPNLIKTPSGKAVLDFGQNIAGFVAFELEAKAGQTITLSMGEFLDAGEFTQANINPVMAGKKTNIEPFQKITYTCKDGVNRYKTHLAIFGFQYVLVETDVPFEAKNFEAIAVYSDMADLVEFHSSSELLNRFVECTRWSGKNNSADVPTDCPQRERAGWTGDAQIFYNTAGYLFDYAAFGRKYIRDIMDEQWENGSFTQMAPRPNMSFYMRLLDSSVGWSDAGVYIPYRMWKLYGDDRPLRENFDALARYAEYMISRCGKSKLFAKKPKVSKESLKYLVMTGMSYGEWCEPRDLVPFDVKEVGRPHLEESTAYTALTMRYMAEIAEHLGMSALAERYRAYEQGCTKAYQELVELDEFSLDTNRQAKLVRPLYMGLLNPEQREYAQKRLLEALDSYAWRIGTGFLSTPFFLFVLEEIDIAFAYRLLENEEIPGWLAMPKNGATTIWETWEGVLGNPVESLNHYSKGAVCEWIFSRMCGVRIAGENAFVIAPKPGGSFTEASLSWQSPYGSIACSWKRTDAQTTYEITVPANTKALLQLPDIDRELTAGHYSFTIETARRSDYE